VDAVKLASPASLNDCMLRNVYRYRYTVVVDFDEFIIPRSHDNYSQLIEHINLMYRPHRLPHTYTFHNTYFFLDLAPDVQQPAHMRTAGFRRHAPPSTINASVYSQLNIIDILQFVYMLHSVTYNKNLKQMSC